MSKLEINMSAQSELEINISAQAISNVSSEKKFELQTPPVGIDARSAYQIALDQGFIGSEAEWLLSLKGDDGANGMSAYEIAVSNGFVGTESEWLASFAAASGGTVSITREAINTLAQSSGLTDGGLYLINDEDRIAVGTSTNTYETYAKENEFFNDTDVALWIPPGNASTLPGVFGTVAPTTVGSLWSTPNTTTNLVTRKKRQGYRSSTNAGSRCGHYINSLQYGLGGAGANSDLGGFDYRCEFAVSDPATVVTARMFVGLIYSLSAPINVEPSTLVKAIGVAQISTSNNLHIAYGGAVAQPPIDLGPNFPANTLSQDCYRLRIRSEKTSSTEVYVTVERLGTPHKFDVVLTRTYTSELPVDILLAHQAWRCNNATALAVGLDICSLKIVTY